MSAPANTAASSATTVSVDDPAIDKPNGVAPLPRGAAIPSLSFHSPASPRRTQAPPQPPSPPTTPSQRLLDSDAGHVQFASYPDAKSRPLVEEEMPLPQGWLPTSLKSWYAIAFSAFLLLLAIALEIAFVETNKRNGWKTSGNLGNVVGAANYLYSLPPVLVAAAIVGLWTWTDMEIKRMQPYVDLAVGDAPPQKSLLLDYTRSSNFVVWTHALYNKHWVVTASSIMVIVTLLFQPLASALLSVKNTWYTTPDVHSQTIATVGLNQSAEFDDLSIFLTAAGYASAAIGYNLQNPPFVNDRYTVTPFTLPTDTKNGTVVANVTVIKTETNCISVPVTMTNHTDGSGWTNTMATQNGCDFVFTVDHSAKDLFGTSVVDCHDTTAPEFLPVVFWFFSYTPSARSSATLCTPTISLVDSTVNLDLGSGNVSIREIGPFNPATSNFGSLSGSLTGDPLNGRAYNGLNFTLNNPDKFILERLSATQLTMPAAVYQAAVKSAQGVEGSFTADLFVNLSNQVYLKYLTLIAKAIYFRANQENLTIQVKAFEPRLWLSAFAVHALTALFILLALASALIHVFHRWERQDLNLYGEPGTIAAAVAVGAETGMGQLLAQQRDPQGIRDALADKKFRIDPYTNKIIMDIEEEYATTSPTDRRLSVFEVMQAKRASRRFSRMTPGSPGLPKSPRTPQSASRAA